MATGTDIDVAAVWWLDLQDYCVWQAWLHAQRHEVVDSCSLRLCQSAAAAASVRRLSTELLFHGLAVAAAGGGPLGASEGGLEHAESVQVAQLVGRRGRLDAKPVWPSYATERYA